MKFRIHHQTFEYVTRYPRYIAKRCIREDRISEYIEKEYIQEEIYVSETGKCSRKRIDVSEKEIEM